MTTSNLTFNNGKAYKFVRKYFSQPDTVLYIVVTEHYYAGVSLFREDSADFYDGMNEFANYDADNFIKKWHGGSEFDIIEECSKKEMDKAVRKAIKVKVANYTKYTNATKED